MRRWLFYTFCLAAFVYAVWCFWRLGNISLNEDSLVTLFVIQAPVEVLPAGSTNWSPGTDGTILKEGDVVRTGDGGSATIKVDGIGESRLGKNSEARVSNAQLSTKNPLSFELELTAGRVWSRLLRLGDLDDSFAVKSNTVIATVRGTAFDLQAQATGTTVWVSESAVQLTPLNGSALSSDAPLVLTEGYMASVDEKGAIHQSRPLSDDDRTTEWFQKNATRDEQFKKNFGETLRARIEATHPAQPSSLRDGFMKVSEKIQLQLHPSEAPARYAAYVLRRLYAISQLIEAGNEGLALQAYGHLEEEMLNTATGERAAEYRHELRRAVRNMEYLLSDIGPASPLYRYKQRLEDVQVKLSEEDPVFVLHARLLQIDARLDEASMLVAQSALDETKSALDAASQGLASADRELDSLSVAASRRQAIQAKMHLLKIREASLRVRLATALSPSSVTIAAPSEGTGAVTSTTDIPPVATSTAAIKKLTLSASPNPANVGDVVRLVVKALREDGTVADVTALSDFELSDTGTGLLNGPTLQVQRSGRVTISASVEEDGKTLTAQTTVSSVEKVTTAPTVRSVSLITGGSTMRGGETRIFKLVAEYSDGSSVDVSPEAKFSSSNGRLGFFLGQTFTANAGVQGSVRVAGTYLKDGKTFTAAADITIQ
jgi:hypothetical protein